VVQPILYTALEETTHLEAKKAKNHDTLKLSTMDHIHEDFATIVQHNQLQQAKERKANSSLSHHARMLFM